MAVERASDSAAHWSRELYDKAVGQAARVVLVVEEDGRMRGFIVAHCIGEEWEIENVVVAATERRKGVGAELLRELLRQAQAAGARRVMLEVRESNAPAVVLYKKAGFSEVGRRKSYYTNPLEDALVLAQEVGGPPAESSAAAS